MNYFANIKQPPTGLVPKYFGSFEKVFEIVKIPIKCYSIILEFLNKKPIIILERWKFMQSALIYLPTGPTPKANCFQLSVVLDFPR